MIPLLNKLKGVLTGNGGASKFVDSVKGIIGEFHLSPEDKLKAEEAMTKLANEHEQAVINATLKQFELEVQDMSNARDANVKIQESQNASWWAKNTGYFLDVFVGLIWGGLTIFIALKQLKLVTIDSADFTGVLSLYATVTAVFMICVQFHRGTSKSSQEKQEQIYRMNSMNQLPSGSENKKTT